MRTVKKKRNTAKYLVLLLIFAVLLIFLGIGVNDDLKTTAYNVIDSRIPSAFDGYKIAQLSDLHNEWYGEGQQELLDAVESGAPDIVVLTGDIIDAYNPDYDSVEKLFAGLSKIAPIYAVAGNHEESLKPEKMLSLYSKYGINYLNDSGTQISINGESIYIYGLNDRPYDDRLSKAIADIPVLNKDSYGILLYHRSDKFDYFINLGYGLVISGHMHGGLIRIPFLGGILTPEKEINLNQKYDGGMYVVNGTTLISNKGLAPSRNVPRIFNRPEVVFITLHST